MNETGLPFVTVLIPAYNAEATIGRSLDSVFLQDYPALEVVVVDDASRDRTSEVVAAYGRPEIRLLRLPKNLGECGAMNEGIRVAKGELIAFLDADDEWLPGKLNRQIPLLVNNPKAVLATCSGRFLDGWGNLDEEFETRPNGVAKDQVWRALLVVSWFAKPCVVARISALRQVGLFDTSLRVSGDQDMWIRLAMAGEVEFVDEILAVMHQTSGSLTQTYRKERDKYGLEMIRRHIAERREMLSDSEVRAILRERYTAVGRNLYRTGRLLKGGQLLAQAMMLGGDRSENLWYLLTASPPARVAKRLLGRRPPVQGKAEPPPPRKSLLAPFEDALAELPEGPPMLIATIDAEAEFSWGTYRRDDTSVANLRHQAPAQELFERFAVRPTYFVDYAVATQAEGYAPLCRIAEAGGCEIGAHLHPWITPPFEEELGAKNSYSQNLPAWLQKEKLSRLTEAIVANFGTRPLAYRAGRYGIDEAAGWILEALDYRIDMSVRPGIDSHRGGGPDFRRAFDRPYWFGPEGSLLEIPLTVSLVGLFPKMRRFEPFLREFYARLVRPAPSRMHLPGVFARLGLLERISLTPEGMSLGEMRRLTRALEARGQRVFVLAYHSSSLLPGNTPYVRSAQDLSRFLATIEAYLEFFFGELGGIATTPADLYRRLRGSKVVNAADSPALCAVP